MARYLAVVTFTDLENGWADGAIDGIVIVSNLLESISAWVPCVGCSADIDGSGVVNVSDLLLIIDNWG